MKRLAVLLTLALLPAPLVVDAQQVAKVPRVGYVLSLSSSGDQPLLEAFRQGFSEFRVR
jgi:hypothetical protein